MDGYLVLLQHGMNDIPVRLFSVEQEAIAYAKKRKWKPSKRERSVFDLDCSTPSVVSIVLFVQGKPYGRRIIKTFN